MEGNQPQYARQALAKLAAKCATFIKNHGYTVQHECRKWRAMQAMAKGRENPQRKRAQSMQIFNQFQLEKSLLFVALRDLILQLFLSVYVGLGTVKRIKTNVRHLREENEVEKDRERQRQSELEEEGRLGWAYSPWPWPGTMLTVIVSYLVNMQSVCVGVCQCVCVDLGVEGGTLTNSFNCVNLIMRLARSGR